jgi:hypothetical protein
MLMSFECAAREHNLTRVVGATALEAARPPISFSMWFNTAGAVVVCAKVSGCAPNLTLTSRDASKGAAQGALTGDADFDAVFSRAPAPLGDSVAALGPNTRRALRDFIAANPKGVTVEVTGGVLMIYAVTRRQDVTSARCSDLIQAALALAKHLTLPANPTDLLMEIARADAAAPAIRSQAFLTLLTHPSASASLLDRALGMALQDPTTPQDMRVAAAERAGRAGVPIMRRYLDTAQDPDLRGRALHHLTEHLSKEDLLDVLTPAWRDWLSAKAPDALTAGFAAAIFRALERAPAAGRINTLALHLPSFDDATNEALVRAMDVQPDQGDDVEAALLQGLSGLSSSRVLRLLPLLRARGGARTVAALRAYLANQADHRAASAIEGAIAAIQAKLPTDLAGSLSLTGDPAAGALSLSSPRDKHTSR